MTLNCCGALAHVLLSSGVGYVLCFPVLNGCIHVRWYLSDDANLQKELCYRDSCVAVNNTLENCSPGRSKGEKCSFLLAYFVSLEEPCIIDFTLPGAYLVCGYLRAAWYYKEGRRILYWLDLAVFPAAFHHYSIIFLTCTSYCSELRSSFFYRFWYSLPRLINTSSMCKAQLHKQHGEKASLNLCHSVIHYYFNNSPVLSNPLSAFVLRA